MIKQIFADFAEYWSFAKHLTTKQRRILLRTLPKTQREKLEESYHKDGWVDLFLRNQLDEIIDEIHREFDVDLIRLRVQILEGKDVFVKKHFWRHVNKNFRGYAAKHTYFVFGGYRVTECEYDAEYKLVPLEAK